ncbi:MAG: hypothetical protein ACLRWQ_03655 [Flavonifractor plautii]
MINATGVVPTPTRRPSQSAGGAAVEKWAIPTWSTTSPPAAGAAGAAVSKSSSSPAREAAPVVNNNAAAAVFLSSLAPAAGRGRPSPGESCGSAGLPGAPRHPGLQSGARLEVGTTNKTRPADYAAALDAGEAQVLLKVHPSNFRVVGFTQAVSLPELGALARKRGVPLFCDLGSAAPGSPELAEAVAWAEMCCFSGDKPLGGPR